MYRTFCPGRPSDEYPQESRSRARRQGLCRIWKRMPSAAQPCRHSREPSPPPRGQRGYAVLLPFELRQENGGRSSPNLRTSPGLQPGPVISRRRAARSCSLPRYRQAPYASSPRLQAPGRLQGQGPLLRLFYCLLSGDLSSRRNILLRDDQLEILPVAHGKDHPVRFDSHQPGRFQVSDNHHLLSHESFG